MLLNPSLHLTISTHLTSKGDDKGNGKRFSAALPRDWHAEEWLNLLLIV